MGQKRIPRTDSNTRQIFKVLQLLDQSISHERVQFYPHLFIRSYRLKSVKYGEKNEHRLNKATA